MRAIKSDIAFFASSNMKQLVTKEDLTREADLLRRDMREMEQRIVIKLGALMAASIGIVAALVKLL